LLVMDLGCCSCKKEIGGLWPNSIAKKNSKNV
jgi:hypothetical protein